MDGRRLVDLIPLLRVAPRSRRNWPRDFSWVTRTRIFALIVETTVWKLESRGKIQVFRFTGHRWGEADEERKGDGGSCSSELHGLALFVTRCFSRSPSPDQLPLWVCGGVFTQISLPEMLELLNELPPGLRWPVGFMGGITSICYVVSEITGSVSQVDRLWAVLPFIYVTYFAFLPLWPTSSFLGVLPYLPKDAPAELSADYSPRALLMAVLTVRWLHTGVADIA